MPGGPVAPPTTRSEPDGPRAAPARARGLEGRRSRRGPWHDRSATQRPRLASPDRRPQRRHPLQPEERCEFCAVDIGERHGHIADLHDHRLLCVCRPCYLLFAPQGAGGGRYRGVGEDVRRVGDLLLDDARWDSLRSPWTWSSSSGRPAPDADLLAFYPGPGGATESELDLAAWGDIGRGQPGARRRLEDDVEAVLLRRHDDGYSCYLVPIDVCYELVGVVRRAWTGLGGGPEVWREIESSSPGSTSAPTVVPRHGGRTGEMSGT